MLILVLIWLALSLVLLMVGVGHQRDGGALTLSYFLALSLLHVPGAAAYIDEHSVLIYDVETTRGFEMTLIGMAAFVAGTIFVRLLAREQVSMPSGLLPKYRQLLLQLSTMVVITGFLSYFVVLPVSRFVPSLTSLVHPLTALLILGLWIRLYVGIVTRDPRQTYVTFLALPLFPTLTTITGGFIGFGVYWGISIISFYMAAVRKRIWILLAAPFVIFIGLSVFVTYMRDRDQVRDIVWYEESSFSDRLSRVASTLTDFEFIDFSNPRHLLALHDRLNQNYFVGLAVLRHEAGYLDLLYGGTVPLWAPIPRAIWPDKPDVGGGRTVVKDVTGLDLTEGTSFGAGQILEFYVNFGTFGVVLGMFGFGALFRWLDRIIIRSLNRLDVRKLLLASMPGFVLLQPTGNLLEMLVATIAAVVGATVIGTIISRSSNMRMYSHAKSV